MIVTRIGNAYLDTLYITVKSKDSICVTNEHDQPITFLRNANEVSIPKSKEHILVGTLYSL